MPAEMMPDPHPPAKPGPQRPDKNNNCGPAVLAAPALGCIKTWTYAGADICIDSHVLSDVRRGRHIIKWRGR